MLLKSFKLQTIRLLKLHPQCMFSNKKFSKLIIDADDYLKDTRFDTSVKNEWLKKEQDLKAHNETKNSTKFKLEKEILETQAEFEEADSILRSFQEKLFVDETNNIEQGERQEADEFVSMTALHFDGLDHQEHIKRSKNFKESLRLRQDWSPVRHLNPQISDQYGNYSHYAKTFPKLKDKDFNQSESNESKNFQKFMKKVDPKANAKIEYLQNKSAANVENIVSEQEIRDSMKEAKIESSRKFFFPNNEDPPPISEEFRNNFMKRTLAKEKLGLESEQGYKYLKKVKRIRRKKGLDNLDDDVDDPIGGADKMDKKGNLDNMRSLEDDENHSKIEKGSTINDFEHPYLNEYGEMRKKLEWKYRPESFDDEEPSVEDPEKQDNVYGRVSPWAKEEIFRLYLEGWNIRDLSVRYGILPERAKAIIWTKKTFYDEIMPRLDIQTVRLGIEKEMMYGMMFPWVDYGLDLDVLIERERGVPLMNFRTANKTIDPKALEDQENRLNRILEGKTKKKHDKIIESFIGTGNRGYFLKSWIVYKGHGSERVNRGFKKAVHYSERRWRLSKNEGEKITSGPRYVGFSHGIK